MSSYGKIVLITNCFTYLCYAVCLFLISDRQDGTLRSAMRMALFWIFFIGVCFVAVINK